MKRKVFTEEELKEVIRLYTEDKWGMKRIGEIYGVSRAIIKKGLLDNNIEIDTPGRRNIGGKSEAVKRYRKKNRPKLSAYHKEWSTNNREHLKEYHAKWRDDNREEYRKYRREYEKNKKDTDPSYRLACYTRTAVWTCLKERNIDKYKSTFEILPYTLTELINHLEKLFTEGMTWDNYGEWHVDHRKPMNSFIMESPSDKTFQECWSLGNLQPLWGEENLSKGCKV